MLDRLADGHTDLVFDYVAGGHAATSTDKTAYLFFSGAPTTAMSAPSSSCDLSQVGAAVGQLVQVAAQGARFGFAVVQ